MVAAAGPTTLAGVLHDRAEAAPDRDIFTFRMAGRTQTLTLSGLRQRAGQLAAMLVESGTAPGDRVLLLIEPGLSYVVAVWACLWAGLVAVTAYPPDPGRMSRTLPRLLRVIGDADASVLLTSSLVDSYAEADLRSIPGVQGLVRLTVDRIDATSGTLEEPRAGLGLAFLQYTSGSTQAPRGVMVSQENVLAQTRLLQNRLALDRVDEVAVMWVPPYHDLGLILGVIKPVCCPGRTVVLSAIEFLARPHLWLETMTTYGGTFSGGPNFAYDLCVDRISEADRATFDLSRWRVAFNGAEPVRAATMRAFAAAYRPAGFRSEFFRPAYGLAEATLVVTIGQPGSSPTEVSVGRAQLGQGRIELLSDADPVEATTVVGLGTPLVDHEVRIVDPASGRATDEVGEVWVRGPCVAEGYWKRPQLTEEVFGAELHGHPGAWLRTGDLGLVHDGQLVITGRAKDLIIIRGKKHYPQDIELTAESAHSLLRKGCGVAFAVDEGGHERLIIVFETRASTTADHRAMVGAIRRAVVIDHGVSVAGVLLVPPGGVPKTSSGKLQRHETRIQWQNGELPLIHESLPES